MRRERGERRGAAREAEGCACDRGRIPATEHALHRGAAGAAGNRRGKKRTRPGGGLAPGAYASRSGDHLTCLHAPAWRDCARLLPALGARAELAVTALHAGWGVQAAAVEWPQEARGARRR